MQTGTARQVLGLQWSGLRVGVSHLGGHGDFTLGLAHCPSDGSGANHYSILPGESLLLRLQASLVQMSAAVKSSFSSCDGKGSGPEAPLPFLFLQ